MNVLGPAFGNNLSQRVFSLRMAKKEYPPAASNFKNQKSGYACDVSDCSIGLKKADVVNLFGSGIWYPTVRY